VPRLVERDAVAGSSARRRSSAPGGLTLRQLQQHRIVGARVGEAVLAETEPPPQVLAHIGRQPREQIGDKLRRLAAQALLALRGTITAEQGEIHVAQGKVIGGGSSING